MTTTREAALEAALQEIMSSDSYESRETFDGSNKHVVITKFGEFGQIAHDAISTPATEPQGYVEGPQFRALKTCKGCAHFKSEYWREPSGDGETYDSGTSADCLKDGRSISTYHGSEPAPPDWCPIAARPAPQPAVDTRVEKWDDMRSVSVSQLETLMAFSDYRGNAMLKAIIGTATPAPSDKIAEAARDVLAERQRQISAEGWAPEHDDQHSSGQMALAAACYALVGSIDRSPGAFKTPLQNWPWQASWWKPTTPRRDLVKAGALIIAEIERLDRALAGKGE